MITSATIQSSTSTRLKHLARHIHQLGERPLYELMCQIVGGDDDPIFLFEQYARLPRSVIVAYGGDTLSNNIILLRPRSS
jgi:hypothetical protein